MAADLSAAWASLQMQLEAHRPDRFAAGDAPTSTVPVCVLTGFLGAGKSTLLAHLLTAPPSGLVVRAVVNDIGALPFDPTFVAKSTPGRVELINGCGCCERTGELAAALHDIATSAPCDVIVVEASGAADPFAQAQIVEANPALRLDRIVTVVSAEHLASTTASGPLASIIERQLDAAHCVIVSGCDRVSMEERETALAEAARRAPGRTITASAPNALASDVLLPSAPRGARPPTNAAAHGDFTVATLTPRGTFTAATLRDALERARPALVRAKGRVLLDGTPFAVQVTPHLIDIAPTTAGPTGLTLIALDPSVITALGALLAASTSAASSTTIHDRTDER